MTVELPAGLNINPDAADGQTSCSDSQANFGSEAEAKCPDNAKIGTASIGTPALDGPLTGSLYIGEPKPDDQYRVFMIVRRVWAQCQAGGVLSARPANRATEGVTSTTFHRFRSTTSNLHLFASDRGLLATPINCTL